MGKRVALIHSSIQSSRTTKIQIATGDEHYPYIVESRIDQLKIRAIPTHETKGLSVLRA